MMNDSIISYWRDTRGAFRGVTALVLTTFIWMQMYPVAAAAKDAIEGDGVGAVTSVHANLIHPKSIAPSNIDPQRATMEALSKTLSGMHVALKKRRDMIVKRKDKKGNLHITITGTKEDIDLTSARNEIVKIRQELASQDQQTESEFKRDSEHIKAYRLSAIIQERHDAAVAKYEKRRDNFRNRLDIIGRSQDLNELVTQTDLLLKSISEYLPKNTKIDPKKLPFRMADEKVREPAITPEALRQILSSNQSGHKSPMLEFTQRQQEASSTEIAAIQKASKNGATYSSLADPVKVASIGTMTGVLALAAVVPPGSEYLTQTDDVQITPAIQALAAQLHNNPVEIYNWVHDNIDYLPTYGSIQGSDMALQTKRGNAYDTSSLLIALLRASGIPARYVYGTVEIPVSKVMNWVGGVTAPSAAQQILGQGGIPNTGLATGGKIVAIRIEHVWVEAYVDAYPSLGSKNKSPEVWMPMDASYKQFDYKQPYDLATAVPVDPNQILAAGTNGATVDISNGIFGNLNTSAVNQAADNYQQRVTSYLAQHPEIHPADLIGSRTIQSVKASAIPSGVPYFVRTVGPKLTSLPQSVETKFQFNIYSAGAVPSLDEPAISFSKNVNQLSGHRLIVSFVPSTSDDANVFASYLPKPGADGKIDPSTIQEYLPGYLIHVNVQLLLDGNVLSSFGPVTWGDSMPTYTSISDPNGTLHESTSNLNVGAISNIYIDTGTESAALAASVNGSIAQAQSNLQGMGNIQDLNYDNVFGLMLFGTALSYASMRSGLAQGICERSNAVCFSKPGFGRFFENLNIRYSYGVAKAVKTDGIALDIAAIVFSINGKLDDAPLRVRVAEVISAQNSALEGTVPFALFGDHADSSKFGISTVSLLKAANDAGQMILLINSTNLSSQMARLTINANDRQTIMDAVSDGKEVITHQTPLTIGTWTGRGLVVQDPLNGSSAYLISGGTNGSLAEMGDSLEKFFTTVKIALPGLNAFAEGVAAALLTLFNAPPGEVGTAAGIEMAEKLGVIASAITGTLAVGDVYEKCNSVLATLLAASVVIGIILLPVVLGLGFAAALILELLLSKLQTFILEEVIEDDKSVCPGEA